MRIRGSQQRIFAVTWIAYAGFYFCRKNLSIALPVLQRTNSLTSLNLANIIFGYSLLYALGQLVCGPLSDKFGPRRIVGMGLVLVVFSNIMMCLHATPMWLLSFAVLNGIGQSTGWSGLVKMMGSWFTGSWRGIVMAWWGTNYVLGGFVATAFATWTVTQSVIAPDLAWRRGFLFPALVLCVVTILFFLFARDTPPVEELERMSTTALPILMKDVTRRWSSGDLVALLRSKALWSIGISYFFLELFRYALLFWLPFFLVSHLHFGLRASGYVSSVYELAGVGGALLAGYVSDRFMQSRRAPVSAMMLCGFGMIMLLPLLTATPGIHAVGIAIAAAGILTYGPDTLLSGAAAQDVGYGVSTATATGLIDGIGHFGALLSPYLVTTLAAHESWNLLFVILSCGSFLAAGCLIPIWNLRPTDQVRTDEVTRDECLTTN